MKKAKSAKILAATVSLLAVAGMAHADVYDINIYGASAQFNFWKAAAPQYLGTGGLNCTVGSFVTATDGSGNHGIVTGTLCNPVGIPGFVANSTVNLRVSKKASYDGIWAVQGVVDTTLPNPADPSLTCQNLDGHTRQMAKADGTLDCFKVTVGASDVKGESFLQASKGLMKGTQAYDNTPTNSTYNPQYNRLTTFTGSNGIDASNITTVYSPVAVPFGFYVNKDVTNNGTPITNLTRLQAVSLFSGGIKNWQDFGTTYANLHTSVCLRHAGSGSHATLDAAVMNGGTWGTPLLKTANNLAFDGSTLLGSKKITYKPANADVYFNDGTGDEMNCITRISGSIGYADADSGFNKASSYPNIFTNGGTGNNILPINYQGVAPTKDNIVNGIYDFWSAEQMYVSNTASASESAIVSNMASYLNNAAHLTGSSFEGYWAAAADIKPTKASDYSYPTR
jgi:ABC-type phosphate transport system substrate-binding protein